MTEPGGTEIPVFRNGSLDIDNLIGSSSVVVSENYTTIVMTLDKAFTEFIKTGDLKSLSLSAYINKVNAKEIKAWYKLYTTQTGGLINDVSTDDGPGVQS